MKMRIAFAAFWLLLSQLALAPGAAGQAADAAEDRFDCDVLGGLQCRAETRAGLLAVYGLPTAESRLAAGGEMYRIFIFNGWMKHHVAIIVERSPGSSPTLILHAPPRPNRGTGAQAIAPVSVPLAIDKWYFVRRAGRSFERTLVPEPKEPGVISICAGHGPVYFVESTVPEADEEHRLRRSGLSSCQEGLAEPFAVEVALLAADVIPACAALDEEPFRAVAEQLRACATLSGDTVAAAQVYNLMRPLLAERSDRPSAEQLKPLLELAQVDGAGAGAGLSPEQAWLQALAGEGWPTFVVEQVHAPNADRVVVDGVIRRRHRLEVEDGYPRDRVEEAIVQLLWVKNTRSDFELERMTIGAYGPAPERCHVRGQTARAADC